MTTHAPHPLDRFFARHPTEVARDLIGFGLSIGGVGGIVVETEAYAPDDPASHSHRGRTERNAAMFGDPATAYVYRSYGLHWCLNFVCTPGSAVLIRALEPRWGVETMAERRGMDVLHRLCAGPGRLAQALAVDRSHDGLALDRPPFALSEGAAGGEVVAGVRIGISRAADLPWRFGISGSPFLSRRLPG